MQYTWDCPFYISIIIKKYCIFFSEDLFYLVDKQYDEMSHHAFVKYPFRGFPLYTCIKGWIPIFVNPPLDIHQCL